MNTQTLIVVGLISGALIGSIILTIETEGKKLVFAESSRLIQQTGDSAVSDLEARSREIAALARSIGGTAEQLPKSEIIFKQVLPKVINFQGDLAVAGGGFWPEPYAFQSQVKLRSFFWGREPDDSLKYYDDYNKQGYHDADWYVVAKYLEPGRCFWSRSYVDPYSNAPMVTCTVATQENRKFSGVATIDLRLAGLQAFTEAWQRKTGGYIFIVDQDNKFITFPEPSLAKKSEKDSSGKSTEDFMQASELTAKQPLFSPIAQALEAMSQEILKRAHEMPNYSQETAAKLDQQSDQIDKQQAELMAAVLANPLKKEEKQTQLFEQFEIKNDWLLKEKSTVYIFHVPSSYWKLVIVKPISESTLVASTMAQVLVTRSVVIIVLGAIIGLVSVRYLLIKLNSLISQANQVGNKITSSTTQIATTGKQLETTVIEQAVSTNEVRANAAEIAATSGKLVLTMEDIAQKAQTTAVAGSKSQASLMEMASAMGQLQTATTFISSRLGVMNEKANNINSVVSAITKVADQTNLLSLNAAIEAEKAGEFGAGFAVVAREIRRLADSTGLASQEIEDMVKDIQSSVSKGVMEMDRFSQQVSNHVELVSLISGQIAFVIEQVQSLTPQFEQVSHSMERQFEGAQHISGAMAQLSKASQQTVESLQATNLVLDELNDSAQALQGIISR